MTSRRTSAPLPSLPIQCLDDGRYWHHHAVYSPGEIGAGCVRISSGWNGVACWPFRSILTSCQPPLPQWQRTGHPPHRRHLYVTTIDSARLHRRIRLSGQDVEGTVRHRYLDALIGALRTEKYEQLIAFARI